MEAISHGSETYTVLAAAMHDHISCTKLPIEITRYKQRQLNGNGFNKEIDLEITAKEIARSGLFGAPYSPDKDLLVQIRTLKATILTQLDLIACLEEQKLKRDRQLQAVKQDREAIYERLERSSRRCAYLTKRLISVNETANLAIGATKKATAETVAVKQDNDRLQEELDRCRKQLARLTGTVVVGRTQSGHSFSAPNSIPSAENSNSLDSTTFSNYFDFNSKPHSATNGLGNGINGKFQDNFAEPAPAFDDDLEISATVGERIKTKIKRSRSKNSDRSDLGGSPSKRSRPSKSTDSFGSGFLANSTGAKDSDGGHQAVNAKEARRIAAAERRRRKRLEQKSIDELIETDDLAPATSHGYPVPTQIFSTAVPYDLVSTRENTSRIISAELDNDVDLLPRADMQRQVETPRFRVVTYANLSAPDDSEKLEDDIFLKRHTKLEQDEKRRKRWDIQRLREEKQNERLRKGRYYSNFTTESDARMKRREPQLESFYPDPMDARIIEITEKLPIIAFGHPIPRLPEKQFMLPWKIGESKPLTTTTVTPATPQLRSIKIKKSS